MGIFSAEGVNLSWALIKIIWGLCGIPLLVISFLALANFIQEGGPQKGSEFWGPVVWILTVIWLLSWIVKGLFF